VVLGPVAPALAQAPRPATAAHAPQLVRQVSLDLEFWLSAVRSHAPGRADRAVALIAPWSRRDLDAILAEVGPLPFVDGALRKRAAVLHADIAVAHRTEDGYSLPSDGRAPDLIQDGRLVGKVAGTVHWSIGRRLLEPLEPDDDVRLWYRATCAFLQDWSEYSELEPHLGRARARFPRDAVLLLYDGALRATYADPRVQNLLRPKIPGTGRDPRPIGDAREEQKEAEGRFEKALALDPDLAEARIRLAHIRGLRGRHEVAAADLRRVVELDLADSMEYFAWLLLGREEEALGRREPARVAFTRAMTLYPGAQSPPLGLSLLARSEGDRAAARRALDLLSDSTRNGADPWRSFHQQHAPDVDELLAEMRRRLAP